MGPVQDAEMQAALEAAAKLRVGLPFCLYQHDLRGVHQNPCCSQNCTVSSTLVLLNPQLGSSYLSLLAPWTFGGDQPSESQ